MIVATINLPDHSTVLVVVIEKDNLLRMMKADPITLESPKKGGVLMQKIQYPDNLSLLIAYEEDQEELYKVVASGDARDLLRWLERKRVWNPEKDGPANFIDLLQKGDH